MKIDRLIGILSILLQQDKVTAPYLAEKFEVSRRTINRDVEDICKAGIPLVTTQGQNGGISIMEGYRLDKTLLTSRDMQSILAGLRSLDSVAGTNRYQLLMEKLSVGSQEVLTSNDHIRIDLSSWYKSSLAPKIELIQNAIEACRLITFRYYSPKGEGEREIEPYLLIFQWSSWYVWGYCGQRGDYRLFKLNRMDKLCDTGVKFEKRQIPDCDCSPRRMYTASIHVKVRCAPQAKWRLIEEYGVACLRAQKDGYLLFEWDFADRNSLFGWLLSFGEQIELLEPQEIREELAGMLDRMQRRYKKEIHMPEES
ncbi:YafY family protein [Blautia hominis]|uniref:YafY family protein n=1 Tax=Blautia hominis TaxID=2025493 RepID=A0ABQ0BC92_9FIRM